jgi:hypothetical protein
MLDSPDDVVRESPASERDFTNLALINNGDEK